MTSPRRVRAGLGEAVTGPGGALSTADRLCAACVDLLEVDGAAISLVHAGATRGTFGSSSALSRRLDAYQFTLGEGPCLDAVQEGRPVVAEDLADPREQRWPAFRASVLADGVRAVFALPVEIATEGVGALDLFRHAAGPLPPGALQGGLVAAHLATLPVQELVAQLARRAATGVLESAEEDPWDELESLERVEVYQATGFLIAQCGTGPAEALLRLRARAFSTGRTALELARDVVEGRSWVDGDGEWHRAPGHGEDPG